MKRKMSKKLLPVLGITAMLCTTPAVLANTSSTTTAPSMQAMEAEPLTGKILGLSKKAKTISVEIKNKAVLVKFNDATEGMEHATVGEGAIISYYTSDKGKIATSIKPKLAKLPDGVLEITPEELVALVQMGPEKGNYFLADARPAGRFAEGSIKGAVSVPVAMLEEKKQTVLPPDLDTLLVFFCGGPT